MKFQALSKSRHVFSFFLVLIAIFNFSGFGAFAAGLDSSAEDLTLKKEAERSMKLARDYLTDHQNADGSWSDPEFPALTALVVYAFLSSPQYSESTELPRFIEKGLDFIVSHAQSNGGIYKEKLPNYNTALCVMALNAAKNPKYHPYILKARRYLVTLQQDTGEPGVADQPFDGGIGYGTKDHSDMSNTYMALEAIKFTEYLESEEYLKRYKELEEFKDKKLDWEAALKFIQRCQNLPGSNDQAWASGDSQNKGGFVYFPGNSKAGEQTLEDGKVALRSYGSMTYAGLLSMIYADLNKDDPRVAAAYEWLGKNYTLEENPGLGQQGLYYYYHTQAKALKILGEDRLAVPGGGAVDWKRELCNKLVALQKGDGSWVNDNGRWWENDPILVTAYGLITMNIVNRE